jgi:UDP-N-acetylglucosamine 2-epimerase (non-hydrolysing)
MRALTHQGMTPRLVHTGQHYDAAMSASFFESLDIPEPAINLGVGSGTHAQQTAAIMIAFERWLDTADADAVLVVGDVNSTVACALVAAKAGIPIGHVEAGLRSFDRSMPEEVNRVLVDALATWLFTPSADGDENLAAEGVEPGRIHRVGNVMVDSLQYALPKVRARATLADLGLHRGQFGLVTLHRPALVERVEHLAQVMATLQEIAADLPLVFPVHPRTRQVIDRLELDLGSTGLRIVPPFGYLDFLALEEGAALVMTDSGGVQEETSVFGVPCLTLRENTERPVTVTLGTNTLVGFDRARIVTAARRALNQPRTPASIPLWDGQACGRIAAVLSVPSALPDFIPPALRRSASREIVARTTRHGSTATTPVPAL